MDWNFTLAGGALSLALGLFLLPTGGCKHSPPRNTMPVAETQAPIIKTAPPPVADSREKELQRQIESMQEQIGILTARTESLGAFHGIRMGPKWAEKVQAARAQASRPPERVRYLEAMKTLLARRLDALRNEIKVYEEFQASDPAIPRP